MKTTTRILICILVSILIALSVSAQKELQPLNKEVTKVAGLTAFINHSKGYVDQTPYEISKGEAATISFEPKQSKSYIMCFDFHGQENLVTIKKFEKEGFLGLFNSDLKADTKEGDKLCMKQFSASGKVTFDYEATYNGVGKLKYDVYIRPSGMSLSEAESSGDLIILDPYLIGDLGGDVGKLLYYIPFNNSILNGESRPFLSYFNTTELSKSVNQTGTTFRNLPNINTFVSDVTLYTYASTGAHTHGVTVGYVYSNGTTLTITSNTVATSYSLINISNPNPNELVNRVYTYHFVADGSNNYTVYETNVSLKSYSMNKTGYVIQGNDALLGYLLSFGSSDDYFGVNHGVDTSVNKSYEGYIFNGVSSIIESTNNIGITGTDKRTIVARVKTSNAHSTIGYIADMGGSSFSNYGLEFRNGKMESGSNSGTLSCSTFTGLNDGNFHTLAAVWNGSNTINYVDGQYCNNGSLSTSTTDSPFHVGGRAQDNNFKFNGTIDYVYVFNRSLSLEEIKALNSSGNYVNNVISEQKTAINFSNNDNIILENLTNLSAYTIAFWINPSGDGGAQQEIFNTYDNKVGVNYNLAGEYTYVFTGLNRIPTQLTPANQWNHFAATYDGSTFKIYVNGVEGYSQASTTSEINAGVARIGGFWNGSSLLNFNGSLDEFFLYNYALNSSEISVLSGGYNASINFTVYDSEDLSILSGELVTIDVYNPSASYSDSVTTTTGYAWLNGLPSGETRINFYSANYDGNTIYQTLTANTDNSINLYMTNASSAGIKDVLLHVTDGSGIALESAKITIYAQNNSGSNFNIVSDVYTNINGEALTELVLDSVWYKFTVSYNGVVCYATTTGFLITSVDDNIYFKCNTKSTYINVRDNYNSVSMNFSAVNNTNVTGYFVLTGSSTNTTYYCLDVVSSNNGYKSLYNSTCVNSTTAIITVNVNSSSYSGSVVFTGSARYIPSGETRFSEPYNLILSFLDVSPLDTGLTGVLIMMVILFIGIVLLIEIPIIGTLFVGFSVFIATLISELSRFKLLPVTALSTTSSVAVGSGILALSIIIAYAISKRGSE